jgi:hypothetical protein
LLEKQSVTQTIQRSLLLVPANTQATSLREQGEGLIFQKYSGSPKGVEIQKFLPIDIPVPLREQKINA